MCCMKQCALLPRRVRTGKRLTGYAFWQRSDQRLRFPARSRRGLWFFPFG